MSIGFAIATQLPLHTFIRNEVFHVGVSASLALTAFTLQSLFFLNSIAIVLKCIPAVANLVVYPQQD